MKGKFNKRPFTRISLGQVILFWVTIGIGHKFATYWIIKIKIIVSFMIFSWTHQDLSGLVISLIIALYSRLLGDTTNNPAFTSAPPGYLRR